MGAYTSCQQSDSESSQEISLEHVSQHSTARVHSETKDKGIKIVRTMVVNADFTFYLKIIPQIMLIPAYMCCSSFQLISTSSST